MNDAQIKHLVERFLGWKLPENFNPDGGISFKKTFNEHTLHPMKHEPTGTNLFDAQQAEEMVRYIVKAMPEDCETQETTMPIPRGQKIAEARGVPYVGPFDKVPLPASLGQKLPIDRPCSACSAGDINMDHHLHYPPFRNL